MSKVVTTRYEYACYDDAAPGANLTLTPPVYPPTQDQYNSTTVGSTAAGYGVTNVNSATGNSVPASVPPASTLLISAAPANATAISCTFTGKATPAGNAASTTVVIGPGQIASVPGAWSGTAFTFQACCPTGAALSATFAAQVLWSF